ncbi:MAG TPA: transcriptional regulator [Pelotomaculum sp.]|nr:transcriptional regulator [Pelotomaculum sp.]
MKILDLFWSASPEELKKGYIEEEAQYICLICGKKIEKGMIYPGEGVLYEAGRYIRVHIEEAHGSVFAYLVQLDKRITGLTEHQKSLLQLFYQGKSDGEVQKEMGIGSASTIRNHRFVLKEKERQAKVFLALMELLKDKNKRSPGYLPPHKTAGMIDDRYNITQEEREKVLKTYFPEGTDGLLKTLDMKEKNKLIVLREITKRFEDEGFYNEKEINEILKTAHEDFVTLRRYLIEYGFIDRKPDGSRYWLKEGLPGMEEEHMDRKKELKQQYKEMKIQGGVFQIRNLKNQKVFVDSIPNLKMKTGKLMLLRSGGYKNRQLQEDWNQFGEDAFVFEVLEVLEEKADGFFDKADELKKLKTKWIEKLQPFGERGYNQPDKRK